jgi:hypothetical protein
MGPGGFDELTLVKGLICWFWVAIGLPCFQMEEDPLALSDGEEESVPVPVGVGPGGGGPVPRFQALLGGNDDKEPAQPAPARAPGAADGERRPSSGQERAANERADSSDSAPLLTSRPAVPAASGGTQRPDESNLTAVEKFDRDVKELMLLYEHQQKMDDIYKLSRFQLVFEVYLIAHRFVRSLCVRLSIQLRIVAVGRSD